MGFREKLKKIFGKKDKHEKFKADLKQIRSDLKRFNSDSNRFNSASKRSNNRFKALESASKFATNEEKKDEIYENRSSSGLTKLSRPVELQKESLQLGVAAGYTGKAIREMETSLSRIESQMASKEWFASNFEDRTPEMLNLLNDIKKTLEKHDSSASNRFKSLLNRSKSIQSALNRMMKTAKTAPEPIKKELVKDIESIESNLPLTPKMEELVDVIKETGQISYGDLSERLDISRSSLRGLLSNTLKRTSEIKRFSKDGKGWVKYNRANTVHTG